MYNIFGVYIINYIKSIFTHTYVSIKHPFDNLSLPRRQNLCLNMCVEQTLKMKKRQNEADKF